MRTDDYFKFGMSVFDAVVKAYPKMEDNRPNTDEFIRRLVEQHEGTEARFGVSQGGNNIFIGEVVKFYEATMKIEKATILDILNKNTHVVTVDEKILPEDCAILYPCFIHKKKNGLIAHIPVIRGFTLDGKDSTRIDIAYENYEKDEGITEYSASLIIKDIVNYIVKKWTEGHELTETEERILKDEILAVIMFENKRVCKKEILETMMDQGMPEVKRLLESNIKI